MSNRDTVSIEDDFILDKYQQNEWKKPDTRKAHYIILFINVQYR